MHWTVAASFIDKFESKKNTWLTPYVPGTRHQFDFVPRAEPLQKWHDRKSAMTGLKDWRLYWQQGMEAIKATQGGLITVFPQPAVVVGMQQRLLGKRIPVIAWLFNVGSCYPGIRQWLSQVSLKQIDCFVVHTRQEREMYNQWLGIPLERFEFVPYQSPEIPITEEENTTDPFLVALGSAHRDFSSLFQAVEKLNIPTVVASGKTALQGYSIPQNVTTPFGIKIQECRRLAQQARISIVPLLPNPLTTAGGQITIVEAMRMGRAIIASRCHGAQDYIEHGKTGLLVEPRSVDDLMQAIEMLWNDSALRDRLGLAAKNYATDNFSDEAVGISLGKILDRVADKVGMY